jgi:hypothetical protein
MILPKFVAGVLSQAWTSETRPGPLPPEDQETGPTPLMVVVALAVAAKSPPPPAPVVEEAPPAEPKGTVVDLLEKIDPKVIQRREWLLREGVLMSPRGAHSLLPVAWLPPVEYDLTCSFKRLYPSGSLSLLFDIAGRQCALVVAGDSDLRIGFETIGGKAMGENGSQHIIAEPLAPDKRLTLTVQVRRSGLSVRLGEQDICQVPGSTINLALDEQWKLPERHVLGLGTRTTQVAIYRLKLTELSGNGAPVAGR